MIGQLENPAREGVPGPGARIGDPLAVRISEATRLTGMGRSKLYELIRSRELTAVKIGGCTLILYASLRRLIESEA